MSDKNVIVANGFPTRKDVIYFIMFRFPLSPDYVCDMCVIACVHCMNLIFWSTCESVFSITLSAFSEIPVFQISAVKPGLDR